MVEVPPRPGACPRQVPTVETPGRSSRSTASHILHQYCCPTQVLDSMKLTPSGRLAESREEEEEEEETEEEEEEDAHQFCCPASECSSPSSR
ncbi:IQ motif and SEC7 domain-containing protein 2 isoform X7 [Manis pentadactyla]|uniref:IQ motif and SEC7 domain-containing protein 2 isoform X7 n=1 Tax=Manis pentadactyla TaxID=143292 RepID=UPI00255CE860|nr:IQ motif and SEC7 domain-containing protein 2 isoform X7 [Manis pentadactyla]